MFYFTENKELLQFAVYQKKLFPPILIVYLCVIHIPPPKKTKTALLTVSSICYLLTLLQMDILAPVRLQQPQVVHLTFCGAGMDGSKVRLV